MSISTMHARRNGIRKAASSAVGPLESRLFLSAVPELSTAPYIAGMGYQLSSDSYYVPREMAVPGNDLVAAPPAGQRPYGAQAGDLAEYMSGSVYVTVVLLESNGAIDPQTEDWTAAEIGQVKSEITSGLTWWETLYANAGFTSTLDFITDFTYADTPFQTSYEPITHLHSDESLWIDQFTVARGYPGSMSGLFNYNDAQRTSHNTDWAFTIFVVDSSADGDGTFADPYFGYAYLGGPYMVMTYDNDGWGISNMEKVTAHEVGHIFYALDEYPGGSDYTDHSGYYNTQNLNAAEGNPAPATRVDSIMAESTRQNAAYAAHTSSPTSLQMVGWKDSDRDNILDVLDRPLTLTGASGTWNQSTLQYTFSATSAVQTLANANPRGSKHNITLNEVDYLQYRVDGGAWISVNASPYRAFSKTFSSQVIALAATPATLELRTLSADSGVTSAIYVANIPVPRVIAVTPPANGTYIAGQNLDFTLTFSEPVTVTGTPLLSLTVGSTFRNASYVSGSGTGSLMFRYSVQAGDSDTDGIAVTSPLIANGGSIRNSGGNDTPGTFAPPNTSGVIVDALMPALASTAVNDGAAQRSMVRSVVVTFSEAVQVDTGAVTVTLAGGAAVPNVTVAMSPADPQTYVLTFSGTAVVGDSLPDGIYDLKVAATGVHDLAGNAFAADYSLRFHRLFGDNNGDRRVNLVDYRALRTTLNRPFRDPLFNSAFDYDSSDTVSILDFVQFRRRYGQRFIY